VEEAIHDDVRRLTVDDGSREFSNPMTWALLTGEYPPQPGGVSDYTRRVAGGLAKAGEEVHVWAPATSDDHAYYDPGVAVHRLPGHFGLQALRRLDAELDCLPAPRRLLVEYVPHAFGWKAMNLPFCLWLGSRRRDSVWSMFHEVAFPLAWNQPPSHNGLAVITRCMAGQVARASERIFYSTTAWLPLLERFGATAPKTWLPIPSNLPETAGAAEIEAARVRLSNGDGSLVIGHFGTYGPQCSSLLMDVFARLLESEAGTVALFAGRGNAQFKERFLSRHASLTQRVRAIETDCDKALSAHLAACDVMVQPYPDGVTTRRSSLMASLALGKAIVTNSGHLTESLWQKSAAVTLVPDLRARAMGDAVRELLGSEPRRIQLGDRAAALYAESFAFCHTLQALAS
jgi:glycosyltransferase involved in cell wall biosynthesis